MSMGHSHKYFGFYISYNILTLRLSIFYLPFIFLIPCTFSPIIPPGGNNPPCNLHFCGSVPVCLVCLCFVFVLGSVVELCELVAILLFIFLIIFFFLDETLHLSYVAS